MQMLILLAMGLRNMQNSIQLLQNPANCPILQASKMQSQVALSTTEAECITLSFALRNIVPLMDLANELYDEYKFDIFALTLIFFAMLLKITLVHFKS